MGFSVSASTAIILVGLFLAVGIIYPAASNGYERVYDAESDRKDAQRELQNTDIEIDSGNTDSTQLTVNNTGSTSLTVSNIDLVVDGEYRSRSSYDTTIDGSGTDLWLPGEQLVVDNFDGFSATDRIKIVTDHGISESEGI